MTSAKLVVPAGTLVQDSGGETLSPTQFGLDLLEPAFFFASIWPSRDDAFSNKMNSIPKLVASRSLERVDEWQNSSLIGGDLVDEVARRKADQDLVVAGSASVVHTLMEHDLVDEYRLLVFPVVLGEGSHLFKHGTAPIDLRLVSAEPAGAAVLSVYSRATER